MGRFDRVLDEYEAGRPQYPADLFDALEPLQGLRVLEGGAGTGIATRDLLARGASVFAFDISGPALRRAVARSAGLRSVVADGATLPFMDSCADVLCFAQSWHWLNVDRRALEAARTIRSGGRWAAWWSHARADGEEWFDGYWNAVESTTGVHRAERDIDRSEDLRVSGYFEGAERITLPWRRELSVDSWLHEERSRTYVASLPRPARERLLSSIEGTLRDAFPAGEMVVPYETRLWLAERNAVSYGT